MGGGGYKDVWELWNVEYLDMLQCSGGWEFCFSVGCIAWCSVILSTIHTQVVWQALLIEKMPCNVPKVFVPRVGLFAVGANCRVCL
jgi:hypothetical protein